MAKKIVEEHPELRDHILLLAEYGHSTRQIARMVSQVNGVRISKNLVWRLLKGHEKELSQTKRDKLPQACPECSGRLFQIADPDDPDRIVCQVCGLVLERRIRFVVPKETQLESYMPSNRLNFSPLGQGNPTPLLIQAINSVNPHFKKRNGDYREFLLKLWALKEHLGVDDRLKKLKDRASKRLAELGFNKRKHYAISNEVGRLIEDFFEHHVKSLPECFQVKKYEFIIDSAIAVVLEDYSGNLPSSLQTDLRVKSLMKEFLPRRLVVQ
jgi:hypothetical protein